MSVAFVTGAASGFGAALCRRLLSAGWDVVASDERDPATWAPTGLRAHRMDVRSDTDVARVTSGLPPIDLLVNNAGYAIFGTQDEVPLDAVRDLFEVNVTGVIRVTRAVLPRVREAQGTIVQLSSIAGRTCFPESGFYAATKHAVEALSEALYQENATFGVKLRVIEPGSFDTGFLPTAVALSPSAPAGSPYASLRPLWNRRKFDLLEAPQDPEWVAAAILGSLADPAPFLRVPVGPDALRILAVRDRLGADGWSLQAGERNGAGAVPTPEAIAGMSDEQRALLVFLRDMRHLDHWSDAPHGAASLAALS